MKLGLQLGYWGAQVPHNHGELVTAAEDHGFDAVFAAESWGSDAFTPLAWWGSRTDRVRLGTSVAQLSGRTPTNCAMHALTLDHLTGGRAILGLGVSGPQVVEGRNVDLPQAARLPIWLGSEGPKNVALTAEIADGWLAIYYSPRLAPMYNEWLDEGFARPGARRTREDFEIAASCQVIVTDDRAAEIANVKPILALYIGGMGAPELNFHAQVYRRMGYEDQVAEIGRLFQEGRKAEAAAVVPDEMVTETMIIGDAAQVRAELDVWESAGVTMLLVTCGDVEQVRRLAAIAK